MRPSDRYADLIDRPARRGQPAAASGRFEHQADAVQAVPLARGGGPVIEDMAQVAATARTVAFGAHPQQFAVRLGPDRARQRLPETGPAGAAVILVLRGIERQITAPAVIRARCVNLVERRGTGAFGALFSH